MRLRQYLANKLASLWKKDKSNDDDTEEGTLASMIIDPAASRPAVVASPFGSPPREISDVTPLEKAEIVDILVDGVDSEIVTLCSRYYFID